MVLHHDQQVVSSLFCTHLHGETLAALFFNMFHLRNRIWQPF